MAKKTLPPGTVGNPGDDAEAAPDKRSPMERENDKQEQKIVELLRSEQLTGGTVNLKRRTLTDTKMNYLTTMAADNFSQQVIAQMFGGGDYFAQFLKADGTFLTSLNFSIDHQIPAKFPGGAGKPEEKTDRTPELVTAVTAAIRANAPPPPAPPDNTLLLAMMKQNGDLMVAALSRNQTPATDPALLAVLQSQTELMREMKAELARGRNNQNNNGGGNIVGELEKIEALGDMLERMAERRGGKGEDKPDRLGQVITALGPAAVPIVNKFLGIAQQETAAPAAALPALPAPSGPAAAVAAANAKAASAQPVETDPMQNPLVAAYMAQFRTAALTAAGKGKDAFDWADSMLDNIGPQYHVQIFTLANAEDWFEKIFGKEAGASLHLSWLLEMRNAILTRALIAEVTANFNATPRPKPEEFAPGFLDRVSVSYHETLADLTEPEEWQRTFAPAKIEAIWLEQLRAAFEKELIEPDAGAAAEPAASPEPARGSATPLPPNEREKTRNAKPGKRAGK